MHRIFIVSGICLVLAPPLFGDTIRLKNGRRIEGKIVYQDGRTVRIRTANGLRAVNRQLIRRLSYGPWNPGADRRPAPERRAPAPAFNRDNERRQWWNFWRGSEGLAPNLPRLPRPAPAPVAPAPDPVPIRPRSQPRAEAPILKEPLKEIFKPRKRDPVTNAVQDHFYLRLGIANGDYLPFLDPALAGYQEFSFLFGELFRRDDRVRELEFRTPWANPNYSMFPVSFRVFLPRAYIDGEYYRSKNSPRYQTSSVLFEQGGSALLEPASFEKVRVDRLFRFRGVLRGGFEAVSREDLKLSAYGGYMTMRVYAKQDSEAIRRSFTQEANGVPVLFDFSESLDRVTNSELRGPTAGGELLYTTPFDMELRLRAGTYQLNGMYSSLNREQIVTASGATVKNLYGLSFVEDRHESQLAVAGFEALLGIRFPAGASRSLFVEFSGESFQTTNSEATAYSYGVTRIGEGKFKPVWQDAREVVELYLFRDVLAGYLDSSDSFWYGSFGMEFRF